MAHKKAGGSSKNNRNSPGQRLGVKLFESEMAEAGNIIIRQRGTKFLPGKNIILSKDHTLVAKIAGKVLFTEKKVKKFDGNMRKQSIVSIMPV
ncbi:MAG: 50S ribosomal protein L27 [Candidatus Gracilibacteria bacterium]|jgi:large subunit ribosomal protein L27|nr:MAG: 50S ribosomal protein L27 [Candidatus Peregrinibacteria bacterium GW2011_GWA2_38_36]KKR04746.1 MAG: 50S ribosomal protein L27, large subunit ribosomal protein L27 [Candidatus Peregrinibacteria bacterium GW2011_GWC2_39_14]